MKLTATQIISELRTKLQVDIGRHLYGVLGAYSDLAAFERTHLAEARGLDGAPFPAPLNLNRALLDSIADNDLRGLIRDEARHPLATQRRLNEHLTTLLTSRLRKARFLIVKQIELIFAYELELTVFRTCATNNKHILLLLPGERRGDRITLFHEAEARFQRILPDNLIADNNLWELPDVQPAWPIPPQTAQRDHRRP
jgi:hypothetical protein